MDDEDKTWIAHITLCIILRQKYIITIFISIPYIHIQYSNINSILLKLLNNRDVVGLAFLEWVPLKGIFIVQRQQNECNPSYKVMQPSMPQRDKH